MYQEQQTGSFVELLRASTVANGRTQRIDDLRWAIGIAAALLALATSLAPGLRPVASAAGIVAALFSTWIWTTVRSKFAETAALIQERFDRRLLGLPWPEDLHAPAQAHIAHLSDRATRSPDKPWYTDVTGLPSPVAETYLQRQNLLWDSDIRASWVKVCVAALALLSAAELVTGLALELTLMNFLLWIVIPTASLISTLALGIRGQLRNVRAKRELVKAADRELERIRVDHSAGSIEATRLAVEERQRMIFDLRKDGARVPNRFHARTRDQREREHASDAASLQKTWAGWDKPV